MILANKSGPLNPVAHDDSYQQIYLTYSHIIMEEWKMAVFEKAIQLRYMYFWRNPFVAMILG